MRAPLWRVSGQVIDLSTRPMIMGVLNVTPDSFSDGGEFFSAQNAIERGRDIAAEGADIIDIGGESTRPGAEPVSVDEELDRVIPVIRALRAATSVFLSIDTAKARVAEEALLAGATIINDVSGGRHDPDMMPTASRHNAAFVVMHMLGSPRTMQLDPQYSDVVAEVAEFFRQQYARAINFGIDPMAIAFDPGIGFGKTLEHNLELLRNVRSLRVEGRPFAVGVSRKSFLGKLIGSASMQNRTAPTVALTALLRNSGADIFRVHDVRDNVSALRVTEALGHPSYD